MPLEGFGLSSRASWGMSAIILLRNTKYAKKLYPTICYFSNITLVYTSSSSNNCDVHVTFFFVVVRADLCKSPSESALALHMTTGSAPKAGTAAGVYQKISGRYPYVV